MKRLTVEDENWGSNIEKEMVNVLKQGGIVLHPTETCYGLAVDIFNEDALRKLYMLKEMPEFKPVSIIVTDKEDAERWADVPDRGKELFDKFWPGPYTFLLNRDGSLPQFFCKGINKVGLRNPAYKSVLNVVKDMGHPITTTSANLFGKPETYDINDFLTQLKSVSSKLQPDLIINGGFLGIQEPSAIYDVVEDVVVRGDIKINE
ncbi:threonylcarbamoyl-AMP synthase [bacterium]|nr:threonylcarbamoyl-AMP synthase [bacterium]